MTIYREVTEIYICKNNDIYSVSKTVCAGKFYTIICKREGSEFNLHICRFDAEQSKFVRIDCMRHTSYQYAMKEMMEHNLINDSSKIILESLEMQLIKVYNLPHYLQLQIYKNIKNSNFSFDTEFKELQSSLENKNLV